MEEARVGAKPRLSDRDLRRRSCDPVPEGQSRRGLAETARDHGKTEAHGQRREDTNLQGAGRGVRFPGSYVRADVFGENRKGVPWVPAIKEEHQAHGRECSGADRPIGELARYHRARGEVEPHAPRMGELLRSRHRQQGVPGNRQLHGCAVTPVVALQAQGQATQGRDLSTPASLRALWARTPVPAWARRAVGEGVRSCPSAGCGRSARPVRRAATGNGALAWIEAPVATGQPLLPIAIGYRASRRLYLGRVETRRRLGTVSFNRYSRELSQVDGRSLVSLLNYPLNI